MKILIYDEGIEKTELVKQVLTKNLNFSVEVIRTTLGSNIISEIQSIKPEFFITDIKIEEQSVCCMNLIKTVKGYSPKTIVILLGRNCVFPCLDCEYGSDELINYDFFIDMENGLQELSGIVCCYPH